MSRILIVGASGYIGSRLAERLSSSGHALTLMSRDVRGLSARFPDATVVAADLLDAASLAGKLGGIEAAYYLWATLGSAPWPRPGPVARSPRPAHVRP